MPNPKNRTLGRQASPPECHGHHENISVRCAASAQCVMAESGLATWLAISAPYGYVTTRPNLTHNCKTCFSYFFHQAASTQIDSRSKQKHFRTSRHACMMEKSWGRRGTCKLSTKRGAGGGARRRDLHILSAPNRIQICASNRGQRSWGFPRGLGFRMPLLTMPTRLLR